MPSGLRPLCPSPSLCTAESIQMSHVGRSATMYKHFIFTAPRYKLDCVACQGEDGLILGLRASCGPYRVYQAHLAWLCINPMLLVSRHITRAHIVRIACIYQTQRLCFSIKCTHLHDPLLNVPCLQCVAISNRGKLYVSRPY